MFRLDHAWLSILTTSRDYRSNIHIPKTLRVVGANRRYA
nr:MAG TPA: hypothetical protein [Caudoviricetes sp.]DAU40687.1 MAG TPA: hypothetical protein [Caudoviricetes sp.]